MEAVRFDPGFELSWTTGRPFRGWLILIADHEPFSGELRIPPVCAVRLRDGKGSGELPSANSTEPPGLTWTLYIYDEAWNCRGVSPGQVFDSDPWSPVSVPTPDPNVSFPGVQP